MVEGPLPSRALFTIPASAPLAPTRPSVSSRSKNALKLSWAAPENVSQEDVTYELFLAEDPRSDLSLAPQSHPPPPPGMWKFELVYAGPEPAAKVQNLTPGQKYAVIVRAINEEGLGEFSDACCVSTTAGAPAPPGPPSCSERGSTEDSVTLSWPASAENGSPIERYVLEIDDGSGGDYRIAYSGLEATCTVSGLDPGRSYRVRVKAENAEGCSVWGPVGAAATAATAPGPPSPPTITSRTANSISLAWREAQDDGGLPVTGYEVWLQGKGRAALWRGEPVGDWQRAAHGAPCATTLSNLRGGCSYAIKVRAVNGRGPGAFSAPTEAATNCCVPEAPASLRASKVQQTSCVIAVQPPPYDGGKPVLSYRLERISYHTAADIAEASDSTPVWSSVWTGEPDAAASIPVLDLLPGRSYGFRALALNAHGLSAATPELAVTTLASAPGPVPGLKLQSHSPTTLRLAWPPPPPNGATVSSYELQLSPSEELQWKVGYTGPEPACELKDLAPNQAYAIRVRGANTVGWGDFCEPQSFSTGPAVPLPPRELTCTFASSASLQLAWTESAQENGRPVTSYTLEVFQSGADGAEDHGVLSASSSFSSARGTVSASNSRNRVVDAKRQWVTRYEGPDRTCVVDGLRPGHPYSVRVRATNSIGLGPPGPTVVISTAAAPPDAPRGLACAARGSNYAKLTWDLPLKDNGSVVTSYRLEMAQDGDFTAATAHHVVELGFKVVGLEPKTFYAFRVFAVNDCGASEPSETLSVETQLLPPLAPELSVTGAVVESWNRSSATLSVALEPPAASDQRAAVQAYEVEVRDGSGSGKSAADAPLKLVTVRDPMAEFPGLECGSLYTFRARCVGADAAGHSPWSRSLQFKAPGEPMARQKSPQATSRKPSFSGVGNEVDFEVDAAGGRAPGGGKQSALVRRSKVAPKAQGPPKGSGAGARGAGLGDLLRLQAVRAGRRAWRWTWDHMGILLLLFVIGIAIMMVVDILSGAAPDII